MQSSISNENEQQQQEKDGESSSCHNNNNSNPISPTEGRSSNIDNNNNSTKRSNQQNASSIATTSQQQELQSTQQTQQQSVSTTIPSQHQPQQTQHDNTFLLPPITEYSLFISVFAILGSCLRVYMGRLFGQDCETKSKGDSQSDFQDFLMPLSEHICVTSGGRTNQIGGALFYDFPANLLGSFIMGFITPNNNNNNNINNNNEFPPVDKFPFLQSDHPLQKDVIYYTGIGVGLCGSLTTFASWNSQMIVMMDGTYCNLGSQVVPALFGYVLGLMGSIASFCFGRNIAMWVCDFKYSSKRNTTTTSSTSMVNADDEEVPSTLTGREPVISIDDDIITNRNSNPSQISSLQQQTQKIDNDNHNSSSWCSYNNTTIILKTLPFVLVLTVLLLFIVVGYVLHGIHFYRNMIAQSITAPLGALLRWKLSSLNNRTTTTTTTSGNDGQRMSWIPLGTLLANLGGATISILCVVLQDRFFKNNNNNNNDRNLWADTILFSIRVGFAGCLSTVSSMVKEIVMLSEKYPRHAKGYLYGVGTILAAICLCLPLYSIIGRVGGL